MSIFTDPENQSSQHYCSPPPDTVLSTPPLPPAALYHAEFIDAVPPTVTLVSRDRVAFRINACILRTASPVFETTLSLPQPQGSQTHEARIDNLDEAATTIEALLRMLTWKEIPRFDTIEEVLPLVLAAEKWDMRGPLSFFETIFSKDIGLAKKQPMMLYWLGRRLQWKEVMRLAPSFICEKDLFQLHSPQFNTVLNSLTFCDLRDLAKLHQVRREKMSDFLTSGGWAASSCGYHYNGEHPTAVSVAARHFRWEFMDYISSQPPSLEVISEAVVRNMTRRSDLETDRCDCGEFHGSATALTPLLNEEWRSLPRTVNDLQEIEEGLFVPPPED